MTPSLRNTTVYAKHVKYKKNRMYFTDTNVQEIQSVDTFA